MNICFAYITPFHPERGGIGRVTHSLTLELQRRGYNVFYLIYPCGITIRHEYDYPAPLEYLPSSDCLSQENIDYYSEYLDRNNIDIVINQSGNFSDSALWVKAREKGIKVISVLHSDPWVSYKHLWSSDVYPLRNSSLIEKFKRVARVLLYPKLKRQAKRLRINHFRKLLPDTDYVCTLSDGYFEALSEMCPGYETKYIAIPNSNSYNEVEIEQNSIVKKKQLLFVGLFGAPKREDRIVELWKRMYRDYPEWELIMIGDGEQGRVQRLKKMAADIPNIVFKGLASALPYQRTASIACMTSSYEGWPLVLPEAMQCGAVPIAFNSFAAASDIIDDGVSGVLVEPFDMKAYERKLRMLMDDDTLRTRMSEAAQHSVKRFDVQRVVDQWEEAFSRCMEL